MPSTEQVSLAPIELRAVSVRYGRHLALDAVDLELLPGTAVALVGPNGSGKTTLLHVLAGLLTPNTGTIASLPNEAAYVLQSHGRGSWMPLTVSEVIRMGTYRHRGPLGRLNAADREAIAVAADRLGVADLRNRQFGELSGGQRQRVLVAQALTQRAPLLLMDEPITGLDLASQQRILDVVAEESASGRIVVISTHHLDEAHHCDQVVLLARRLVASGIPADVLQPDVLRLAYQDRLFDAHRGHDHPTGVLLIDDHGHDHDHDHSPA